MEFGDDMDDYFGDPTTFNPVPPSCQNFPLITILFRGEVSLKVSDWISTIFNTTKWQKQMLACTEVIKMCDGEMAIKFTEHILCLNAPHSISQDISIFIWQSGLKLPAQITLPK